MAIVDAPELIDRLELTRLDVGRRLSPHRRSEMGQFFTPAKIARFMAELSQTNASDIRLLDPGAGVGSLSAAWIAAACSRTQKPRRIHVTAYEADPELVPFLGRTFDECTELCGSVGVKLVADVIEADFIETAVELIGARPLFDARGAARLFNCTILNPPYRKLNSQSQTRHALRSVGIETSNLYTAFVWLAFRLLEADGELIGITPRSFCNGPYFRPFREAFLQQMKLRRIHLFESRTSAFKDAEVLQENVIFRAVKTKVSGRATISSSAGPDDPDIYDREVTENELISPADSVIHIVPDGLGNLFSQRVNELPASLSDLGIQVSTGRVVDFRARDALSFDDSGSTVPLIYPIHLEAGYITWPKPGKKPNYLEVGPNTRDLLVAAGCYVLVKRFSAKEEKRRVTAAICDPARLPSTDYGFENHLNYYHRRRGPLPEPLAKGLAVYLNSTLVDSYFRQFSGHTQVNASDLRSLKYPDRGTLVRIGQRVSATFPDQPKIDAIIREEIGMPSDDPVRIKTRIDEVIEILDSLGLPKRQQNERSALTLLALLDLEPNQPWSEASAPLRGITPMMDWFAEHYRKRYAPNSRETVRRQTVHQFIEAGLIRANPDEPQRPINSGKTVYQVEPRTLTLLRTFGTKRWNRQLRNWLASVETLTAKYARDRELHRIPLKLATGEEIALSPGGQNVLVKRIIDDFCPRFVPGGKPIYVGDTDKKWAYFNSKRLAALGVEVDTHGKMPDLVVYHSRKKWLVLIEAVTTHGPVDGKRRDELSQLFRNSTAGLVFVTAFLDRATMVKHLSEISWETEVWVADAPSHLIHFNGTRFLGPY